MFERTLANNYQWPLRDKVLHVYEFQGCDYEGLFEQIALHYKQL